MFDVSVDSAFDFLSDEYAELFSRSNATPFQHPLWLDRLYATLVPHFAAEPLTLVVRFRENGRLALVLPLVRRRHGMMRVVEFADLRVSDYAAPVCSDATFAIILRDASACEQIRRSLKPFDILRILKLRAQTLPLERLLDVRSRTCMDMSTHAVALRAPFFEWRAENLDASYRKELDKKSRQLRRKGEVRFECVDDPELIKETFYSMREYRRPRFQDRGNGDLLQKAPYFEFYLDVAMRGQNTLCRTYMMSMDKRPIAGVMGLAHRGEFLVILGGFDQGGYKRQSIGALAFEQIARDCTERGDSVLDFTIGDEPYKQLFGARPAAMWMISRPGTPLGSFAGFAMKHAPWVKNVAKRLVDKRPPTAAAHPTGQSATGETLL